MNNKLQLIIDYVWVFMKRFIYTVHVFLPILFTYGQTLHTYKKYPSTPSSEFGGIYLRRF